MQSSHQISGIGIFPASSSESFQFSIGEEKDGFKFNVRLCLEMVNRKPIEVEGGIEPTEVEAKDYQITYQGKLAKSRIIKTFLKQHIEFVKLNEAISRVKGFFTLRFDTPQYPGQIFVSSAFQIASKKSYALYCMRKDKVGKFDMDFILCSETEEDE